MAQALRIVACHMMVKATMSVRFNLVVPLAHKATAMRITDTAFGYTVWSGAVSPLIACIWASVGRRR